MFACLSTIQHRLGRFFCIWYRSCMAAFKVVHSVTSCSWTPLPWPGSLCGHALWPSCMSKLHGLPGLHMHGQACGRLPHAVPQQSTELPSAVPWQLQVDLCYVLQMLTDELLFWAALSTSMALLLLHSHPLLTLPSARACLQGVCMSSSLFIIPFHSFICLFAAAEPARGAVASRGGQLLLSPGAFAMSTHRASLSNAVQEAIKVSPQEGPLCGGM